MPGDFHGTRHTTGQHDRANGGWNPSRTIAIKDAIDRLDDGHVRAFSGQRRLAHVYRPDERRLSPDVKAPDFAWPKSMEAPARCPTSCPEVLW